MTRKTRAPGIWTLAVLLLLVAAPMDSAGSPRGKMWRQWGAIRLKASAAMFLSGSVELSDAVSPAADGSPERRIETHTRARFLGATLARSETVSRIDPETGRTIEFVDKQPKRARRYRFDETGYTVERLEPGEAGENASLDEWVVYASARFENPEGAERIYDYFSLLMRLDELGIEATGEHADVWVATSDGPQPYRIKLGEQRSGIRKIEHGGSQGRDTVPTDEIRLRVDALDPDSASDTFLGMRGETEIWVEAGSKTLLEIRGKVPRVPGKVVLSLHELL